MHVPLGKVCEVNANSCHYTIYGTYYLSGKFCSKELLIVFNCLSPVYNYI